MASYAAVVHRGLPEPSNPSPAAAPAERPAPPAAVSVPVEDVLLIVDINNICAGAHTERSESTGLSSELNWDALQVVVKSIYPEARLRAVAAMCKGDKPKLGAAMNAEWEVLEGSRYGLREMHVDENITVCIVKAACEQSVLVENGNRTGGLAVVLVSGDRDQRSAVATALTYGAQVRVWAWSDSVSDCFQQLQASPLHRNRLDVGFLDCMAPALKHRQPLGETFLPLCGSLSNPVVCSSAVKEIWSTIPHTVALLELRILIDRLGHTSAKALSLVDTEHDFRVCVNWKALAQVMQPSSCADSWRGFVFAMSDALLDGHMEDYGLSAVRFAPSRHDRDEPKEINCDMCAKMVQYSLLAKAKGRRLCFQLMCPRLEMMPAIRFARTCGMHVSVFGWRGAVMDRFRSDAALVFLDDVPDLYHVAFDDVSHKPTTPNSIVVPRGVRAHDIGARLLAARFPYTFTVREDEDGNTIIALPSHKGSMEEPLEVLTRMLPGCNMISGVAYVHSAWRRYSTDAAVRQAVRLRRALSSDSDSCTTSSSSSDDIGFTKVQHKRRSRSSSHGSR